MSTDSKEILSALTLARLSYFNVAIFRQMLERAGSFSVIIENSANVRDLLPDCPQRIVTAMASTAEARSRAEVEMEYMQKTGVTPLIITADDYPQRLRECDDAPLALFYRGNANLNSRRMINIVGTRHATVYADDCIRKFVTRLAELSPGTVVVSGLAYGVDIMAHRHSLSVGLPTVGVLAHGLDTLYPARHRNTAAEMLNNGGLLTEFFTQTNADKVNFVRRNRIVAGMCDATVLVESAAHGGGLITTSLARDYNRDVFAFPGRAGDQYSEGCNNAIRDNLAALINNADDFVKAMRWTDDAVLAKAQKKGIERTLFPELPEEAQRIVEQLQKNNDMQLNMLATRAGLPISRATALLFELEMKGVVKTMAGGIYHLLG